MALKKEGSTAVATAPAPEVKAETAAPVTADSGTAAAVDRLKKKTEVTTKTENKYSGRSYDDNARGKTRCVQFEAALMSPAIAGMKFDTMEQYLVLVRQAADAGVAYTFDETK